MTNIGFDARCLRVGLEDWCLEHFAHPWDLERFTWPAHRSACISEVLFVHMGQHGVPGRYLCGDVWVPFPHCNVKRCRVAGVAFALFELTEYEAAPRAAVEMYRLQGLSRSLAEVDPEGSERASLQARRLRDHLQSSTLRVSPTGGRPSQPLAKAIAQHLFRGGFKQADVAKFMGTTSEAIRKRCADGDWRTIAPYEEDAGGGGFPSLQSAQA